MGWSRQRKMTMQEIWEAQEQLSETFSHHEYIRSELARAKEEAKDPDARWLSEDEFWTGFEDR